MQAPQNRPIVQRRGLLVVILGIAAIIGFAMGAGLGQLSKPNGAPSPAFPSATSGAPTSSPTQTSAPTATSSPTPSTTPAKEVLLTRSGSGDFTSDAFEAKKGWQVQWQTDADPFSLSIHGDPELGTISDHPGPASGVVSPPVTGTFRIEIKAQGPWTVAILQGVG